MTSSNGATRSWKVMKRSFIWYKSLSRQKKLAREIQSLTKEFADRADMNLIHRIEEISGEIIELEAH